MKNMKIMKIILQNRLVNLKKKVEMVVGGLLMVLVLDLGVLILFQLFQSLEHALQLFFKHQKL
jgi:hypothetical protein